MERADLISLCDQYTNKFRELMPAPGQLKNENSPNLVAQIENDEALVRIMDRIKEHVVIHDLDQEFGFAEVKVIQQLLQNNQSIKTIRETIWSRSRC